jgi:hypothetical protein
MPMERYIIRSTEPNEYLLAWLTKPHSSELTSNDISRPLRLKRSLTKLDHDDRDQSMFVTIILYMSCVIRLTILQCPASQAISLQKKQRECFARSLGLYRLGSKKTEEPGI